MGRKARAITKAKDNEKEDAETNVSGDIIIKEPQEKDAVEENIDRTSANSAKGNM